MSQNSGNLSLAGLGRGLNLCRLFSHIGYAARHFKETLLTIHNQNSTALTYKRRQTLTKRHTDTVRTDGVSEVAGQVHGPAHVSVSSS